MHFAQGHDYVQSNRIQHWLSAYVKLLLNWGCVEACCAQDEVGHNALWYTILHLFSDTFLNQMQTAKEDVAFELVSMELKLDPLYILNRLWGTQFLYQTPSRYQLIITFCILPSWILNLANGWEVVILCSPINSFFSIMHAYGPTGCSSNCSSVMKLLSEAVFKPVITMRWDRTGQDLLPYFALLCHIFIPDEGCKRMCGIWTS